jgi:hypothetical protein
MPQFTPLIETIHFDKGETISNMSMSQAFFGNVLDKLGVKLNISLTRFNKLGQTPTL